MKNIYLCSLFLCVISFARMNNLQQDKSEQNFDPMFGVKNKIETRLSYEEKFGLYSVSDKNEIVFEFDRNGNEIKQLKYLDDLLHYKENKIYDSSGNLTKTIIHYLLSEDSSKTEYQYDSSNNLISKSKYDFDGNIEWVTKLKYDSSGNIIEETDYDENGDLYEWFLGYCKSVSVYDIDNNILQITYYSINGLLDDFNRWGCSKRFFKYDSNGFLIEETGYLSDETLHYKSVLTYSLNGNLVDKTVLYNDPLSDYRIRNSYDTFGNNISKNSYYIDGTINMKLLMKYDKNNRLSEKQGFHYVAKFGDLIEIPSSKTTYEYIDF
jgi:hypothetical protein